MNHFINTRDTDLKNIYKVVLNNISSIGLFTSIVAIVSIIVSLLLPPQFATNSVILPYANSQQSGVGGLLQSSLGVNLGSDQGINYSRIFDDLFLSYDFIEDILNKSIQNKDGDEKFVVDFIVNRELNKDLKNDQIKLLAQSILVSNHLSVSYDSYKSLVYLRILFGDEVLSLNLHNLILEEFDAYLSNLKNTKLQQKNLKLIQKLSTVDIELKGLEEKKENFVNNNKNISGSPYLLKELNTIEREISVKENIYLTISSQIELNKVDLSIEKNNFRILNKPILPVKPSSPNKKLIVIFSTMIAFVIASLYHVIKQKNDYEKHI